MVKRYFVIFSLILIYFENVRAQEIAYCNNNGKCGQIRNYNLLIKLPCTKFESRKSNKYFHSLIGEVAKVTPFYGTEYASEGGGSRHSSVSCIPVN